MQIARPVRYDKKEFLVIDGNHKALCDVRLIMKDPFIVMHEKGQAIADAINHNCDHSHCVKGKVRA